MTDEFDAVPREPAPLPCPFCGEALVVKDDHHGEWWGHRNEHSGCFAGIDQLHDVDDLKRWNRRAP